ncbi:unnamed protein product [Rotaria magnacalcarata]|uniref:Methylosome subunit pICln n=1 Tax=Rotaria magnacalcarata TaxID=392030 RepID=A0A816QN19_9BILA|nr:unnamed protein product [Rotaria magnacalcarata]CAF2062169.1 unnamed protein product [Rotaria magnacalcarata]
MPSILNTITYPSDYIRQQYSLVKAYLEDEYLGQGNLCVSENQLVWAVTSNETERAGISIDYPSLTMHGIVTHDPKYPEEHLVVVVQKAKEDEEDDENSENHQGDGDQQRSDSPVEYDSIRTVNYRFVMATSEDLKIAYQTIAECQALHPDPLDDMVEDDEVGSDIDYGEEDENNGNANGNGHNDDDDPYGYNAHFASSNQELRGSHFTSRRRGQHDDQGDNDKNEEME